MNEDSKFTLRYRVIGSLYGFAFTGSAYEVAGFLHGLTLSLKEQGKSLFVDSCAPVES